MILEIDLQLCYASDKARPIDSSAVKALAHSIAKSGLLKSDSRPARTEIPGWPDA